MKQNILYYELRGSYDAEIRRAASGEWYINIFDLISRRVKYELRGIHEELVSDYDYSARPQFVVDMYAIIDNGCDYREDSEIISKRVLHYPIGTLLQITGEEFATNIQFILDNFK